MKSFLPQNYYLSISIRIIIVVAILFIFIGIRNDTSGIRVSKDYSTLTCNSKIKVDSDENIQSQICTFNHILNFTSNEDRASIVNFSQKTLEFPLVGRYDVAQYFYIKVIEGNPDDALSIYLKEYKVEG